jgi:type II secretory pathway pseudopilin PulG
MIELLVVIAIIAILVAILMPTIMRAKESARGAQCLSQMHDVYVALSQYHDDNKVYPPVLFGFVETAGSGGSNTLYAGSGSAVDMYNVQYRPLFSQQKYLKDITKFFCPDNPHNSPSEGFTNAACPSMLPSCPNDGSNKCNNSPCAWLTAVDVHAMGSTPEGAADKTVPYYFQADSYDTGPAINSSGAPVPNQTSPTVELRYSLDWTGAEETGDPTAIANDQANYPNQLKYPEPPADRTVVTWCTYHAALAGASTVNVLMLSGTIKAAPVEKWMQTGPLGFKF